jgi:MFS family permease
MKSILRDAVFLRLWLAVTVSSFGSSITTVGMGLLAATVLGATPMQMGLLSAAFTMPFVVIGPIVGVYADRLCRRNILIAADLARAGVLVSVPLAMLLGWLDMRVLYVVAVCLGVGDVWFEVAYGSYLPVMVQRERLIEAHSKLQVSQSASEVAGPGVSGLLIQGVGLQVGVLIDAATFLFSALAIGSIANREAAPSRGGGSLQAVWRDLKEGVAYLLSDVLLRALTLRMALWQLVSSSVLTMLVLFAANTLSLDASQIGLLFSAMGVGMFAGANLAQRVSAALGVGRTIALTNFCGALALLLVPFTPSAPASALVALCVELFAYGFCQINYYVNNASLRQAVTSDSMLGRVGASSRTVALAMHGVGAVAVGALAERLGLREALTIVGLAGMALAGAGLSHGSLRAIAQLPGGGT